MRQRGGGDDALDLIAEHPDSNVGGRRLERRQNLEGVGCRCITIQGLAAEGVASLIGLSVSPSEKLRTKPGDGTGSTVENAWRSKAWMGDREAEWAEHRGCARVRICRGEAGGRGEGSRRRLRAGPGAASRQLIGCGRGARASNTLLTISFRTNRLRRHFGGNGRRWLEWKFGGAQSCPCCRARGAAGCGGRGMVAYKS